MDSPKGKLNMDNGHKDILKKVISSGLNMLSAPVGDAVNLVMDVMEKRKQARIARYTKALLKVGYEAPPSGHEQHDENFDIAFGDLLQACMDDSDLEKTEHYAWLTAAICGQLIDPLERRHFIKALKAISSDDLQLLQKLYIVSRHRPMLEGIDRIAQQADLCAPAKLGAIGKLSIDQFRILGFFGEKSLTELGNRFIESTHHRDQLFPEAVGWGTWRKESICLITQREVTKRRIEVIEALRTEKFIADVVSADKFPLKKEELPKSRFFLIFEPLPSITYSYQQRISGFIRENTAKCILIKPGESLDSLAYRKYFDNPHYIEIASYIATELGYPTSDSLFAER